MALGSTGGVLCDEDWTVFDVIADVSINARVVEVWSGALLHFSIPVCLWCNSAKHLLCILGKCIITYL